MTEARVSAPSSWPSALLLGVATAVLILAAGMMMFSAFMFYDDEGYVLISLKNYAEHGHLYGEVYSQYGPFPYVLYYILHLLGLPLTHTAGRLLTIGAWSGAAIASASLVWRESRSLPARLAVLASAFVYLWIMVSEPTHPGGMIAFITAMLAYFGHRWIGADRTRAWGRLAGIGAAVLLLTKINIGAFATLSAVAWFLLHHENATLRRYAPAVLIAAVAALPFALMRPLLEKEWVQTYAIMFACSGVAAMGAAALAATPRVNWRAFGAGAVWAGIVGAVVIAVIFARGTSPAELVEGVVLGPLHHPVNFNLNFSWPAGVRAAAAASTFLFVAAWLLRRRGLAQVDDAVAILRLVGAVALAMLILQFPAHSPDNLLLSFAVPWLWLFLWPLAGEDASAVAARSWVGLLFLGQCLHGFPVRGSQTAWGTFLALPLAALGAWQAARWLALRFPVGVFRRPATGFALRLAVLAFAATTSWRLIQVGNRYQEGRDLDLPGAEPLRLPENATALFQLLTLNAAAHGDMLFSLPGMFSLNLWSGLPTPTLANVTHWFSLLDDSQQQAIIRSLEAHPRACVVVQREHVAFISKRGFVPSGLLHDYIRANFVPAFTVDDFEFCVRKGRKIVPLSVGEILTRRDASATDPEGSLLKFAVLLPAGRAVDSVELRAIDAPSVPPLVLRGSAVRVEVTPINLRGEPTAATESRSWPIAINGPANISLYFDRKGFRAPPDKTLVVLHDATGADLVLVRLQP